MFELTDKTALVTGAGSGIGRGIAETFVAQGARVGIADIDLEAAETVAEHLGEAAQDLQCDVTNRAQCSKALGAVVDTWGHCDIVVCSAGISFVGDIEATQDADWDRVLAVNLTGSFNVAKEAIPQFRTQGGGVLIFVASVLGIVGSRERIAYCASKGGVVSLTRALALDHAHENIRVNAICPGTIHTGMTEILIEEHYEDREAALKMFHSRQPTGKMGEPADVAAAAVYLASDNAKFVTGSLLTVDGAWTTG